MREPATRERIGVFLEALAAAATRDTDVFLVGGTTAVLFGWRETTMDVDFVMRPESDALLRAIPALKERLRLNVELAAPDQFIPVVPGWEARSPIERRIGHLTVRHYDLVAQALAKVERGHSRDLADVQAMIARGLVTPAALRAAYAEIEPHMYRYPAVDAATFRVALEALLGAPEHG